MTCTECALECLGPCNAHYWGCCAVSWGVCRTQTMNGKHPWVCSSYMWTAAGKTFVSFVLPGTPGSSVTTITAACCVFDWVATLQGSQLGLSEQYSITFYEFPFLWCKYSNLWHPRPTQEFTDLQLVVFNLRLYSVAVM